MEISWLGHSCVRIRSNGVTLITDPYDTSLGLSMGRQTADIVTVSNQHPNHANHAAIGGNPRVLQSPGEYEIASFYITGMGTDRNGDDGEAGTNTVFVLETEGVTLCHLGDLNHPLTARQIEELSQPEVLFVPAGGVCTIGPDQVAELVNRVAPKIVVPMHYRDGKSKVEIQPLDPFLNDMGVTEPSRSSKINVTATNLPKELRVEVLEQVS